MLLKYCTCAKRTSWVKRLAGEECKIVFSAWACKHTNIILSFLGLCTQSSVWNVSSANRGECVTTGGLYRPTHLCLAHFELHKKFDSFFLWCGKVRGLGGWVWWSMFQEVGVCLGFQRGVGWAEFRALTAWGKSCWAVWRSGLWCSGTVFMMVGAGRDCGRDGLHDTIGFAGASCKENILDGGERGTDDFCSCVHCLAVCKL